MDVECGRRQLKKTIMKQSQIVMSFMALILATLVACSSSNDQKETPISGEPLQTANEVGKLPDFAMTDARGNTVNLNSFKGRKVFVNLWATWCRPCRTEIPSIEELAGKLSKEDVVFVMLSLDENFEIAKTYAQNEKLKVPVYYPAEKLPLMFQTEGIPATFIFDRHGSLIKQNFGADDYSADAYFDLLMKK